MILPCGKNIDIIPNFRLEAQVDAATKSGSHDFHFTVHFCNSAVSQRGEVAALICIREVTTVVGYMTITRPAAYQNSCGGSMFTNVSGGSYKLSDLKIDGPTSKANGRNNYIVFWAAGSTIKVDKTRSYWWDPVGLKWRIRSGTNFNNDPDVENADEITINPGEGFLCNFMQATTTITYSGAVIEGTEKKFTITRPEAYQNFVAVNTSAGEIDLSQITISGPTSKANGRNNYIVFMAEGSTIKVDKARAYWWDPVGLKWRVRSGTNFNNDPDCDDPTAVKIAAGEGFLCNFMQATTTLTMPTSL